MNILGISTFGENPAACLVVDGILRAFCHEERFNHLKVSSGLFPSQALAWCLKSNGLVLRNIDRIAVSWGCTKYPWQMLRKLIGVHLRLPMRVSADPSSIRRSGGQDMAWLYLLEHTPAVFEQKIRDHLRDSGHAGPIPPIEFIPHHLAHAYQAFYQSPFDEAAVLVVDGSGEDSAASGYHFGPSSDRRCFAIHVPQSLGWFYSAFTAYLGFHASRDEGKLMGLAALGTDSSAQNPWLAWLDRALKVSEEEFELDPYMLKFAGNEYHPRFTDALRRFILSHDPRLEPVRVGELAEIDGRSQAKYLLPQYVDLAFAVQHKLEEALLALVRRLRRATNSSNLCLAGGVFLNCKANGRILDESGVGGLFVHPAASDDGAAIGAAFVVAQGCDRLMHNTLRHTQVGPAFSDNEIRAALETTGVQFSTPPDIAEKTADLLAEGKFCGWFHGAMEMGARALGGRSIVACPQNPDVRLKINQRVKYREVWRPYCPSMTSESGARFLKRTSTAPFMNVARHASAELRRCGSATVHVDGTVRPQTVEADVLPGWHHLLSEVGARTGDPLLLNTSFNVRGEPIVCTPFDAIRCFWGTGLDALAIGPFLVEKG